MNNDLEQFSEERLKDMQKHVTAGMTLGHADALLIRQALDLAIAAKQANPDYYIVRLDTVDAWGSDIDLTSFEDELSASKCKDDHGGVIIPCYTTPRPAHTEQDGWVSIPKDMLADYRDVKNSELQSYKASFGSHCDIPRSRWQRDLADLTEELDKIDKLIAAAPKLGGWINCSELMPEEMEDVLVTDGEDVKSMWWNGREWDSFVGKHQYSIGSDEITYWMPLPAPLKQDK